MLVSRVKGEVLERREIERLRERERERWRYPLENVGLNLEYLCREKCKWAENGVYLRVMPLVDS